MNTLDLYEAEHFVNSLS